MQKKHRFGIAGRLVLYFTVCLLLFSIIMGTVFGILLYRNARQTYVSNLEQTANSIKDMIASALRRRGKLVIGGSEEGEEAAVPPGDGEFPGRPETDDGSGDVFRPDGDFTISTETLAAFIAGLTKSNVWLVAPDESGESFDMLFLLRDSNYVDTEYDHLGQSQKEFIETVYSSAAPVNYNTGVFSSALHRDTITVGASIRRSDGVPMGVVLIHGYTSEIFETMKGGIAALGFGILMALPIGFVGALLLARHFTKPLLKINDTATQISEGDYSARTEVKRADEIGMLAGTIDDMSEKLRAASEESEKTQKLRQDFIANISHELRTPVTVIRGSLVALCDTVGTDEETVNNYHRELLKESVYMQRLVNDLLDLSRLQNPDFSMNIGEFNLFDCISDAVRSGRRVADGRGIAVDFSYDTVEFGYRGDYDRIRQMLLIVVDNAVKFTDPPVHPVRVDFNGGFVRITNTGAGISQEELPYIFEKFYRSRSEENKNGTGLGLSIARQIAERHGIGLAVKSELDGDTTFTFDFNGTENN